MKPINYLPIAITALAINSGGFASAEFSELLEHKFTIALTQSKEADEVYKETSTGYTESVKIEKLKISNKEILIFLDEEGVIDGISGWSIVQRTENGRYEGIFLVHKDGAEIDASDWFEYDGEWEDSNTYNYAYSASQKDTDETETYNSTEVYTDTGSFSFYYENEEEVVDLWADGTFTYAAKSLYILDVLEDEYTTSIYDITLLSLEDAVGKVEDFNEFAGTISGSVTTGSGKAVNVE